MKRHGARWILAACLLVGTAGSVQAEDDPTAMTVHEARNALGTMEYQVFVPSGLSGRVPLFVHIHGGNVSVVDVAQQSRLNELAIQRGFVVVYPQEDPARNAGIWDGDVAAAEGREGRATSLIAQITREVMAAHPVDPRRVFVGGISAGSTMAIVMAAQYPDLYTAMQAEGGDRYGPATVGEQPAGRDVLEAMGPRARRIPFMLSIGTLDPFGITTNTGSVMRHWLIAQDGADDGEINGSIPLTPASTRTGFDGKNYSVETYHDAQGCVLAELWRIEGMFHAYSGGAPAAIYDITADPDAPHMRAVAYDFFLDRTDADGPTGCRKALVPDASAGSPGAVSLAGLLGLVLLRRRQIPRSRADQRVLGP